MRDVVVHLTLEGLWQPLQALTQEVHRMSAAVDALTVQVAENTTVMASAKVLIEGIAQRIADAGVDPAKLGALTLELRAADDALAAAVAANTPTPP